MRVVKDLNILSGKKELHAVVVLSVSALAVVVAGEILIALITEPVLGVGWLALWVTVGYAASLPVHELIHGLFFKLLGGKQTHVRFGYSNGMLYATSPGSRYRKPAFVAILLAPFVVLSLVYALVGALVGDASLWWLLFSLHGSGCVGDFYFVWQTAGTPEADLCEDTDHGMRLLASEGDPPDAPVRDEPDQTEEDRAGMESKELQR